jgi:hypothetical protein
MDALFRWVKVLVQVFDYLVKAAVEFKDTEAGRAEWQDILDAYETAIQLDLDGDGSIGKDPAPQATSPAAQPRSQTAEQNRSVFG